ncbi:DUF4856 domain-containing protein [Flavobacterium sp. WV_118_3]|uniref:DUF4856 domain-containing protein n=1 Tax=Flavobacterium sp. WV_118_3 TaxID=3151764 RepID=UPI00321A9A23
MRFRKITAAVLIASAFTVSCSNDSNDTPQQTIAIQVHANPAQALTRVKMLVEFDAYSKDKTLYPLTKAKIKGMFTNSGNPFSEAALNTSGVSLKEKTAENAKPEFDLFFTEMGDVAATYQIPAAKGVKGSYTTATSTRLFNEKGLEINQAIIKGLMGAVLLDQTLNYCLNPAVLNAAANTEEAQQLWEEGYNYIFGYKGPDNNKKYFWESYLNTVNGNANFSGITQSVTAAFEKGKATIIAGNKIERDKQINIIREKLSKVGAIRAVYYMNKAKGKLSGTTTITGDLAAAFHGLSEAYGFISGLAYTHNPATGQPYLTKARVTELLTSFLGGNDGFWDANYTADQIDLISKTIAAAFGFTVEQAITQGGSH